MTKKEYKPWEKSSEKLEDLVEQTRTTKEVTEGEAAVAGIREKMSGVLKKDQALKVSMYTPEPEPERKEGDVWTDARGRGWRIKDGKKEAYSVLQDAKRPWFCPQCQKVMNSKVDDRMWTLRGKCFDCVVKEETKMRIDGTWEKYEKERILSNQIAFMKDKLDELTSWMKNISNPEFHFQDGRFERWEVGVDQIKADIQGEIDQLQALLKQAQDYYETEFPTGVAGTKSDD